MMLHRLWSAFESIAQVAVSPRGDKHARRDKLSYNAPAKDRMRRPDKRGDCAVLPQRPRVPGHEVSFGETRSLLVVPADVAQTLRQSARQGITKVVGDSWPRRYPDPGSSDPYYENRA